jgi:peptidoglycan/xylan/chitin deacetylase (PgdA/CDA1 family)
MINYKTIRFLFWGFFVIITALIFTAHISYLYLIGLIFMYVNVQFIYSFNIRKNFFLKSVCSLPNLKQQIAITFDDGPLEKITPTVLDLLKKHGAKATFFCIGNRIEGNESILKRMHDEGHLICNHTYSHSNFFGFFSTKKIIEEIKNTANLISGIIGEENKLFRPPFGITNPYVTSAIKVLGYTVIGWNKRTYDGSLRDQKKILANATKDLKSGDIVLFHDNHHQIIEILEVFLKHISEKGLTSERVDVLMCCRV